MGKILLLFFLLPHVGLAHPGVGIVKDSKGNIYYTDLSQVWKISKGKKSVVVPAVHTHELYIDLDDNLFGEGGYYDDKTKKFYHYLWVYRANGRVDTVIGMKEQYLQQDFSLAKDKKGNEYYSKRFLIPHTDTSYIYKKTPGGQETIFATGNFKDVNWLHPQDDGSLLYILNNAIYRIDSSGNTKLLKDQIGNTKPSFKFPGVSITIWGTWQDHNKNVYAAVFSDQVVKKIDTNGNMTEVYKSKGDWAPLHGVFDNDHNLWVLESSATNNVRVTLAEGPNQTSKKPKYNMLVSITVVSLACMIFLFYRQSDYHKSKKNKQAAT